MVTLINKFTVNGDFDEFERIWAQSADFMRSQKGFIGFKLHRSLSRPDVYVNVALWESQADHQRVLASPEFAEHIKELAAVAVPDPDLYTVVLEGAPAQ
ncbi:antibiotic biosynthesis monooxygenase family protein [Streptomyces sp. NPDC048710]|uniref:antibiotic biosynthesis monooxygenase family protein n=1 Tax=unclassified Streptomyces TaxID=2593676 RepID=UPI00371A2464